METYAALVGTYRTVHLHAIPLVYHNLARIVHPRYAEHNHALGLGDALQHLHLHELRILQNIRSDALDHLANGLMELELVGVFGYHVGHEMLDVLFH